MSQQESNIAVSFLGIHSIITRGLTVSIENARVFSQQGFKEEKSREGFLNYLRALSSVVNAHHLTEDEIAFPYFRDILPDAPFKSLSETHQLMVQILGEINQALEKAESIVQPAAELKDLERALTRLNDLWRPHIEIETNEFINKADALIPVEEQLRLVKQFSEHGQKHAVPPYLTVPFMLYNLSAEDRKVFSQAVPAEVTQNLVPVVWKDKWETMKPFFLD